MASLLPNSQHCHFIAKKNPLITSYHITVHHTILLLKNVITNNNIYNTNKTINNIPLLQTEDDEKARNSAKKYFFVVGDDEVIDPTNKAGLLDLEIKFLGGLIKVDTMLGRVNEPPKGKSVNVFTRLNGPDATVVADRDIFPDGGSLTRLF
jgi:hypothetical protein